MAGLERLSLCMTYIENNLDSAIDYDHLASIFLTSRFHLLRMFTILTGFTLAEYIRNRRLTVAAQELLSPRTKVIDVALKYGYETPESFSKAFKKLHGIRPSEVKKTGCNIKAFPPLSFQINVKGEAYMDYKIVEREGFKVIGKGKRVSMKGEENFKVIPKFWNDVNSSSTGELIENLASDLGALGICMHFSPEQESFTYFIGVEKGSHELPEGWEVEQIPASTWAVFDCVGAMPNAIQEMTTKIHAEWFPATGYQHAGTAEIEVYPPQETDIHASDYHTQIWIPVVK